MGTIEDSPLCTQMYEDIPVLLLWMSYDLPKAAARSLRQPLRPMPHHQNP
jgi:hypothetical protein